MARTSCVMIMQGFNVSVEMAQKMKKVRILLYRDRTVLQNSKESIYETANGIFGKFYSSLSFSAMKHKVLLQYNLTSQKAQDLPETVYPA